MSDNLLTTGAIRSAPVAPAMLSLRVLARAQIATDVVLFTLGSDDGSALPPFAAGAHIVVQTPSGLARRYSLCNAPAERDRYLIAVKREASGGGGSISMIDQVAAGDILAVGSPENHFALAEEATEHLLIAGGIGITPIIAMARHLAQTGSPFRLIYCARSREAAAFHDELAASPFAPRTTLHFDQGERAQSLDLSSLLAERTEGLHVYCCGPRALMDAVRQGTRHWPSRTVHFEDFGTSDHAGLQSDRPFRVRLARSGAVLEVPSGMSILDVLRAHGYDVPSSCESGTCGTCRTGLLSGIADHRDYVLDDCEHATDIMICVSRAVSAELTLDL